MQWQDVLADKSLQDLPYKIELNEKGNIEMSPASNKHGAIQVELCYILRSELKAGRPITECSIQTNKGVKVADVAWASNEFLTSYKLETPYSKSPEICIEILSPSNTPAEMAEKIHLYLKTGAQEVWLVTEDGDISFYNKDGQTDSSLFDIQIDKITLNI
jgi:Uma2 family endonuclease